MCAGSDNERKKRRNDCRSGAFFANLLEQAPVAVARGETVGRVKLLHREADAPEERAGIVVRGADALVFREAVVVDRDDELAVAFETDERKLPERRIPETVGIGENKLLREGGKNVCRDLRDTVERYGAVPLGDLHGKRDRIDRFHNADGLICLRGDLPVGGIYLDAALAAEENDALIEYAKTGDRLGVRHALARDAVKIRDVHRIVASVEGDLLYIHPGIEQLGAFGTDAEGIFYVALRCPCRKHPQILHAVLIPAAGIDLLRMDTNRFPDINVVHII